MLHQLALSAALKHRQAGAQLQVLEDVEIALGSFARDSCFPHQGHQADL